MNKRVVVTGTGVVSPVGVGIDAFWESLCAGRSGIGRVTRFDTTGYRCQIAGEAGELQLKGGTKKDKFRLDRYIIMALVAADEAWEQSGIDMDQEDPDRFGVIMGSGIGGIETITHEIERLRDTGPRRVSPLMMPKGLCNMASGNMAIRYGLTGPNKSVVSACSTANHCFGHAFDLIQLGDADVVLAGGSEAAIIPFGLAGFAAMRALSTRNHEPEKACRPFDKDRDGFVMGEGAGVLVMESEEHAKKRGATIIGEICGLGETCDAYHVTMPHPEAVTSAKALKRALDKAKVNPEDVDHFNAHGTSTPYNDVGETKALKAVFGENMPLVTSTKSMTGHLLGAAGAAEAIACLLAIRDNVVPPTINYETPDPECDVNLVANEAREADVAIALSNSLGFGGHNAAIVCKRYE